jgi:hypothetical protein
MRSKKIVARAVLVLLLLASFVFLWPMWVVLGLVVVVFVIAGSITFGLDWLWTTATR